MKNSFVMMAVLAATMSAAFAENRARDAGSFKLPTKSVNGHCGSKKGYQHQHNPAGSKLIRRFYKAKTGLRGDYEEAAAHYAARQQ